MAEHISILRRFEQKDFCLIIAKFSNNMPAPSVFLSKEEEKEFLLLKHLKRRTERAASLHVLHQSLGIKHALVHAPNNAPYLQGTNMQISLSHTNEYIAIVLHQHSKVGVDIERVERNIEHIAPRFLSSQEQSFCISQTHRCLVWCAKETIFKLAQNNNINFVTQIEVQAFNPSPRGTMQVSLLQNNKTHPYQLHYLIINNIAVVYNLP